MSDIKISSNRSFGIVFFIVFLLISVYPLINDENIRFNDNGYYQLKVDEFIDSKIYLKNNQIDVIEFKLNNMNVELSNINLVKLDSININKYFNIEDMSSSIFDLRSK